MTSNAAGPRALVVGHGDFAAGAVSAVGAITGRAGDFVALSNTGLGPDGIERAIRETVETLSLAVVFTDLPGGSCTIAARKVQRLQPALVVAAGSSVATLLDFAMNDSMAPRDAAARAVARGRDAMLLVEGAGAR
jgi:PTS system N-acetylgalactosamine-specific IIA component